MTTKNVALRWIAVLLSLLLMGSSYVQPAHAQEEPVKDANCINCHEEQYILFDTGKAYCLRTLQPHCTACHGGQADTPLQELAHQGMDPRPIKANDTVCRDCHPQDYQAHIDKFVAIAGISHTLHPSPTPTKALIASNGKVKSLLPVQRPQENRLEWRMLAAGLAAAALLVALALGCRCTWQDRKAQR